MRPAPALPARRALSAPLARLPLAACALLAACAHAPPAVPLEALQRQVIDTEKAFAKTMADRDHAAFGAFVAEEAVFFGGKGPQRGKEAITAAWKRFFEKPAAPFSWEPETVEVLPSGTLALSTGPVRDPAGKVFATFSSIWRQQSPGVWRIVFDKGNDVCDCAAK